MPDAKTARAARRAATLRLWRLGSDEALPGDPFIALAPGAEAPLLRVTLPDTLKGAAREGVALRQLRDRLGGGAEGLLLRPARFGRRDDAWSGVLTAERDAVTRWQAQIRSARSRCRAVLPDYLALPAAPGLWTVQAVAGPDGVMVQARLGVHDGFSAEAPLAAQLLAQALERARALGALPAAVLRLGPAEEAVDNALGDMPVHTAIDTLPPGLPQPRMLAHGELALDLGHDPRAAVAATQARLLALRWPIALAAIGLAGWAMATEIQTRREFARAEAINAATIEAVRRDFLPSGPLLDIPAQVSRVLNERRAPPEDTTGQPTQLDMVHVSAARLAAQPQALQSLVLQPQSGVTLELELPDFSTLEALLSALRADGLSVRTLRSGTGTDGQVTATVAIGREDAQ